jgi:L-ascorbate metabolism protein UlaG (beta-lactamase superfamily)
MDITWLGHAATRVRTRNAAIVMDPTDRSGGDMGRPDAHIVTVSHDHPRHSYVEGIKNFNRGEVMVLDGPGEYEILGVQVEAVDAHAPSQEQATADSDGASSAPAGERRRIFAFAAEEMTFAHLGGLREAPTGEVAELLAGRNLLIVPIGCDDGLEPAAAAAIVRNLEAKIVIPVGYEPQKSGTSAELKSFIDELGVPADDPVSRATIQRRNLGDTLRVVVLESRG